MVKKLKSISMPSIPFVPRMICVWPWQFSASVPTIRNNTADARQYFLENFPNGISII